MNTVGIVGYGTFVPRLRISVDEIATTWKKDPQKIKEGLGLKEKAVAAIDEDTATISVEIARNACEDFGIDPIKIGAIYIGSESHPYAVKPTAAIVGEAIGAGPEFMAADLEFACKAGTAGIQACMGRYGANPNARTVGPKMATSGILNASAMCIMPESFVRRNDSLETTAINSFSDVNPVKSL
jgi:hydroxymethylglutaryl-CoA synthase